MNFLFFIILLIDCRNSVLFYIFDNMLYYIIQFFNQRRFLVLSCLGFCLFIININENKKNDLIKLVSDLKWG